MRQITRVIETEEELRAVTDNRRRRILDALREPDSAASVARLLAEPRQRINHHVKELARVGLLHNAGERRKGNFVEQLYVATASTLVLSPRLSWGDGEPRRQALADQASLDALVRFGNEVHADAAVLLDRAAFDGDSIASASVQTTIRLRDSEARAAFLDEYLDLVRQLVERHAAPDGEEYAVGFATYPSVRNQS